MVLEKGEVWDETRTGFEFVHTKIIFTNNGKLYYVITDRRFATESDVPLEEFEQEGILIPYEDVRPMCPRRAGFSRAPNPLPLNCYVKTPSLLEHTRGSTRSLRLILQEARVCQVLAKYPHPNISKYYGCQVDNGRIMGLCFAQFEQTLDDRKWDPEIITQADAWFEGIRRGVLHLHSLGLVHNDINPSNIMFAAGDNTPVLIDFDSCRPIGAPLGIKSGTLGWSAHEGGKRLSLPENDLYGLRKIREFLNEWKRKAQKAAREGEVLKKTAFRWPW